MITTSTYLANWRFIEQQQQNESYMITQEKTDYSEQYDYQPGQFVYVLNKNIKRKLNQDKSGLFEIILPHTNGTLTICRSPTVIERINIRRVHPV